MRFRVCSALLLLLAACASAPAAPSMPRPHAFVSTPPSGPSIRLVSAPMDPVPPPSQIGKMDLEQARALLSWARSDLEPLGPLLAVLVLLYPSSTAPADPRCKPIPLPRHLGGHDPHN
jgi:hypothetical protein